MKKHVLIITSGNYPSGDAGAVRIQMIAKALAESKCEINVLCFSKVNDCGIKDGINYVSLRKKQGNIIVRIRERLAFKKRVKEFILSHEEVTHIYIYNAPISVFKFCKKHCKNNKLKLIYDCVEWYSPEEFCGGKLNFFYREKQRINAQIVDNSFSVISISSFLEEYYKSKGINTIRVPILCDSACKSINKSCSEKLVLFYAGAPVKKDYIGNLLEALLLLTQEEQKKIKFLLIGANKDKLIKQSGISSSTIEACSEMLELCGRVPREEVIEKMLEADFTVLPRDASLRYAKAGFPSKVVESLSNSTPILCNLSSDLDLYLKDGENAIIADSHHPEDLAKAVRRTLELSTEMKHEMRAKARESAEKYFDYRNYSDLLIDYCGLKGE